MPWLQWHKRDDDLKAAAATPYRLLEPIQSLSHGDEDAPNMLIQGDNMEALKALLPYYAGQVKCIFIDPPYNTKSAFEHYDDNLEHATWLSMMYPRMVLLRELLSEDGSIWITLDDNEAHYFKVMCDEIFGRKKFIANMVWQKRTSRENRAAVGSAHDDLFVYAKLPAAEWKKHRNLLPPKEGGFKNPDNDPNGSWRPIPFTAQGFRANQMYEIATPSGRVVRPPKGRCWGAVEETFKSYIEQGRVYFGKKGDAQPVIKKYQGEERGLVPMTWWTAEECGDNTAAKREILELFPDDDAPFSTPKPEMLISRILTIATNEGDLVLDSFLGSGTTAAVAHKMERRWIGVEMGEHARTHCQPRLVKVIGGEQGGISKPVDWKGGGGFRFYQLGPKVFDDQGRIDPDIKFEHLAAHIWFAETGTARCTRAMKSPVLGVHNGTAYYLLYNGILGDKTLSGGNMLTMKVLAGLPKHDGPMVIYGEGTNMTNDRLRSLGIKFKKTPNDIRAR